ncbi:hypothetical protein F2P81_022070 [Scophthalmus maximus]|uniref:Protein kinase domain-containing protein n=1 Tax=Scophthalmus maximus TaxID=52904 RepID=A0A6A4RY19_SCOMX|nr:hypothetical protein F2P81_022070 [Scophthalmus maximus]
MSTVLRMTDSFTAVKQEERNSEEFEVKNGDLFKSNTSCYLFLDFVGEGSYGKVAKCMNLITAQDVALKIFKTEDDTDTKIEIDMLEVLSVLDPVKTNVVQYFERLKYRGHTCLAFEMLDRNLHQLLKDREYEPLSVSEIRLIAEQLLIALDALRGLGVIHGDLKPENIMLVNHENEPFRVKLIDFGLSCMTSEVTRGMTLQTLGYRAPEVVLGLPITKEIDMWSLGCVLSFLYMASHLFGVCSEYQMVRSIVEVLGQPADDILSAGYFTSIYFKVNQNWDYPKWLLKIYPKTQESIEIDDCRAFVSLLKGLLQMDPKTRITPAKAFRHPFLSMNHLVEEMDTSLYAFASFEKMMVCQTSDELEDDDIPYPKGEDVAAHVSNDNSSLPDRVAAAGVDKGSVGQMLVCKTDDSQEQTLVNEAEEKPKVDGLTATLSLQTQLLLAPMKAMQTCLMEKQLLVQMKRNQLSAKMPPVLIRLRRHLPLMGHLMKMHPSK